MNTTTEVQRRRYLATAAHHERMARIFDQMGQKADAESARKAAEMCRKSAEEVR